MTSPVTTPDRMDEPVRATPSQPRRAGTATRQGNDTTASANILVVGIGGQGVMTASDVLARAALACGLDVCKTEVAGMSQRGGVVSSQVRIGAQVLACEITPGQVDLLIALEAAEALRWSHWLAPRGWVLANTLRVEPPVVSAGMAQYPADPWQQLQLPGRQSRRVDACAVAAQLGDARLANTVMLGAAADLLPLPAQTLLEQVLARFGANPALRDSNARAFAMGRMGSDGVRSCLLPPLVRS